MSCSNEIELISPKIPQITNGIIWLIEVFRLRVKKGKGPLAGPFLNGRLPKGRRIRSKLLFPGRREGREQPVRLFRIRCGERRSLRRIGVAVNDRRRIQVAALLLCDPLRRTGHAGGRRRTPPTILETLA